MSGSEVAGLPAAGPATTALVKAHLKITDAVDDERLDAITAAVNAAVRTWPCSLDSSAPDTEEEDRVWSARTVEGAVLLSARVFRRKNSPAGVEAFGDLGPVYVQRNDPDVAMLLRLGSWSGPEVG